jgi:hypothetical protein
MAKKKRDIVETWIDKPQRILIGGVAIGLGGYALYRLGKGIIENIKKNQTQSNVGENLETQQATVLRTSMNPSGISWMKSFDTTDSNTILATASQIKDLNSVVKSYKNLYQDDLMTDLQSELSTEDYKKFLSIVQGNSQAKGTTATAYAKPQQLIVAIKDVTVRKTPDASYHGAWYESESENNIVIVAKAASFIGYATGKQQYDAKNDVKFIEVGYQFLKTGLPTSIQKYAGVVYRYWVSSSSNYITKLNSAKEFLASYPNLANEVKYKKAIGTLGELSGLFPKAVITKVATSLYDENLHPSIKVESKTILGNYLMSLNTGTTNYVKFKTIDNTERWVKANDIQIINQ